MSSLLIIWVGVYQVVSGDLSLGQLITFRIIALCDRTILRLSNLAKFPAGRNINGELADIVDQVPEAGEKDADQISLPPIKGNVSFEDLKFRFGSQGEPQINGVELSVKAGSFIGIVGQSGGGKARMKLLLDFMNLIMKDFS